RLAPPSYTNSSSCGRPARAIHRRARGASAIILAMRMPPTDSPDALSRELARERIQSAQRINLLRFWDDSAFFALFLLLGGLLRLPAWTGNLGLFAAYWVVTLVLFLAARRSVEVARFGTLALALLDVPMVFLLQWQTFPTSPSVSGVAGFTVGVYVLLVILAALSLENGYIVFTAAIAALFEIELQYLADVSVGAMASTVILLGLTAIACSYARFRLVALVERLDRDIAEQQKAETALRQAERMAALAELGREPSGTLRPAAGGPRAVGPARRAGGRRGHRRWHRTVARREDGGALPRRTRAGHARHGRGQRRPHARLSSRRLDRARRRRGRAGVCRGPRRHRRR